MTEIIRTVAEIQKYVEKQKSQGKKVGLIPSMGAFHQGHLTLMNKARKECGAVIVSVFVNPIQFSAGEDYDQYPRQPDRDLKMVESEEVDILFIPDVAQMYPKGFDTHVDQNEKGLPSKLCGPFRPGHFRGVMTVVLKTFCIVRPDLSYLGQKDYQQYLIIRRMSLDLNLGAEVRLLPTVREEDGLAMSSRNIYLGPENRKPKQKPRPQDRNPKHLTVSNGELVGLLGGRFRCGHVWFISFRQRGGGIRLHF